MHLFVLLLLFLEQLDSRLEILFAELLCRLAAVERGIAADLILVVVVVERCGLNVARLVPSKPSQLTCCLLVALVCRRELRDAGR